ncbi:MAG: hypothetical protein J0M25_10850, partial [Flavobacteriales bacterium]|nr:hypothetical protein [Flavobacteriales bacterium]
TEKDRELLQKLILKYQDQLNYFTHLKSSDQNDRMIEIVTNIERYRSLLITMNLNDDIEFYEKQKAIFNSYNKRFERFKRKNE